MRAIFLALLFGAATASAWASDTEAGIRRCSALEDGLKRLACFDDIAAVLNGAADQEVAASVASAEDKGKWQQSIEASKIDDSTTVVLRLEAESPIVDRFERSHLPALIIRCMEKVSALYWTFDGLFVADSGGFGKVTVRLDREKARTFQTSASTDNQALGLWSGGQAIPFIRSMLDNSTMLVRMTPFSDSPVEMEFDIRGLAEAARPLQKACGWSTAAKSK